jgi:hypothetical protein
VWRCDPARRHGCTPLQALSCPGLRARPPDIVPQNERLAACGERREADPPGTVGSGAGTRQHRRTISAHQQRRAVPGWVLRAGARWHRFCCFVLQAWSMTHASISPVYAPSPFVLGEDSGGALARQEAPTLQGVHRWGTRLRR